MANGIQMFPGGFVCLVAWAGQVPSGYYLTDAFLRLDEIMGKKLLKPNREKRETRMYCAGREAVRAKKCVGALRYLWRSTKTAHDAKVNDMKACLLPSPSKARGAQDAGRSKQLWSCSSLLQTLAFPIEVSPLSLQKQKVSQATRAYTFASASSGRGRWPWPP